MNSYCIGSIQYNNPIGLPIRKYTFHDNNGVPVNVDGGGLMDAEGTMVPNSSKFQSGLYGYEIIEDEISYEDKDVIWISELASREWGHAITDSMKHLWWFHSAEFQQYKDRPIYCIIQKEIQGNYKRLFELAGLNVCNLNFLDKPTRFKSAIVPDNCFESGGGKEKIQPYIHEEYLKLIDSIISRCNSCIKTYEKLYLARRCKDRRTWTSHKLEVILKRKGYHKLYMEDYCLDDQISFMQNAKEIVAPVDSCAHNTIFCKPGTKVFLLRKNFSNNEYQELINSVRSLDIRYVDCHLSIRNYLSQQYTGPFFLYANDDFCQCFGVKTPPFPINEFKKYCNHFLYDADLERFRVGDKYLSILISEIHRQQKYYEDKYAFIRHIPGIPSSIKERIYLKIVKTMTRRVI